MSHVTSHISMSHVTHINKSCHTYEWVMSRHTYLWVMSHISISRVIRKAKERSIISVPISHVTHMNESCHTYEWVMSHISISTHESFQTYKSVPMSHLLTYPPDPINNLCSLTGVCISQKIFSYLSVQIFKILFQGFYAPGSDPPHKIMRYWFYFSTLLSRWFPPDQNGQAEIFCTRLVLAPKGQIGGAGPPIFLNDS